MRLSDWWSQRTLKRALRRYATDVRRRLVSLYGRSDTYSPGRVRRAVEESDANTRYIAYAYALYCTPERFVEETQASAAEAADAVATLAGVRKEIVGVAGGGILLSASEGYDGSGSFADPRGLVFDSGSAGLSGGIDGNGGVDGGGVPDGG